MINITGSCLCGLISYTGEAEIKMALNCHCTDCQKATGSVHGTMVFVEENKVTISAEPAAYSHVVPSGSTLTKLFCSVCGSQVFGKNSSRPGIIGIRAGSLDQKDSIMPTANIFCDSAVPSTPLNQNLKSFPKGPA